MFINEDFKAITSFVHDEFMQVQEMYGITELPAKDISIVPNAVVKKMKIFSKLECWKDKQRVKVEKAIFTMPHGKTWIFFHKRLWLKVQSELEARKVEEKEEERNEPIAAPVQVLPKMDIEASNYPSDLQSH